MTRKLWQFHGGIHLDGRKNISTSRPVLPARLPRFLTLPLQQHIGEAAEPLVKVGDKVLKGQMIASASGYVSVPLHAPSSGTVVAIEERAVPHPSGMSAPCIVIETDGRETWAQRTPPSEHYARLDPSALRNQIREAGIVGLGGAGFPSFIKLNPGPGKAVDTLILNGAECEPYITCDEMLMRERPQEIIDGLLIMRHALQARHCAIGVEDNKPEAIEALRAEVAERRLTDLQVVAVPTLYPAGGEKQLIKTLTGKEVPSGGLPLHAGVVCHNVATAAAVFRAVTHGEPLISRIVTVTGGAVAEPRNLDVLFGTPIDDLLAQCGGTLPSLERLVMGGPMMGFALPHGALPVVKTTNCVLAAAAGEFGEERPAMPCIRCGACADVCPANLLPQQLYWYARAKDFDKVQDYSLFDCIECGCCSYVCPSNLPLVQYYRFAKTEIWGQERERQKADMARRRHEFRQERLEREKAEREARHRQKKAGVTKGAKDDAKQAAIQAALERTRKKREQAGIAPGNTEGLTPAQQRQISEADARRGAGGEAERDKQAPTATQPAVVQQEEKE